MGILRKDKKSADSSSTSSTSPCANLRTAYHNCFNRWYSEKFVKGQWDKEECVSEWRKYKACLSEHLEDKHLSRFLDAEESVDYSRISR
ncbi:Mitochondrial distribution/morphology family protein [Trema orientale]|uniref:Mitochondrial distribution/morphology family protein n=1 Tax=Trema orientale TaxID=63057 RepID=A0A2P5FDV7_TREOI|nr:Mitochondrial distribution/morphology family protein [Trema orientale]